MKRSSLISLIMAVPFITMAQTAVFTDNFSNGSTTNKNSVPGGTPTASSTSYDIGSSKTTIGYTLVAPQDLRLTLSAATGSGFWEAQALFTASPITLATVGDFINFSYTFTNTGGTLLAGGTSSAIYNGLYNSGGSIPVAGALANSGLTGTSGSPYGSGNCANWQGYVANIANGGSSKIFTRPVQNSAAGTPSANQDLIGNGFGSGTYTNPPGITLGTLTAAAALTSGSVYTVNYTIALTAAGTLTITNNLYSGVGTTGSLVFSQTNTAATTNVLTTSFDGLAIGARNSGTSFNPTMDISLITISASIAGSPGPLFTVSGGGSTCPGDTVLVGLTGSVTTNAYFLYTNGVLDGAVGVQNGTGSAFYFPPETVLSVALTNTVLASNTVNNATGFMSGSVLVAPLPGPVITSQPVPMLVATNSAGIFAVSATGGGLGYRWYRNGVALTDGGEFSGSATTNLLIYPATTADVATTAQGYYCIISNSCGLSVASTTNSLTLSAPANLVWRGGNPNTNWDLSLTPNFTNSVGTSVVFHGGDNVTFNDSSAYPVVSLVGNFIVPTLITENANQNYAFTGNGSIGGGASLLMNGAGVLTISNANSFTGGTTINGSGTLKAQNYAALGTGLVTLNNGTFEIPIAGSATVGLTNNINVTGNSTLQYDQSGTYAAVLYGALSASSGITLNIYNYNGNTVTSRVRLYGSFTNNASIVLSSLGATVEIAPYNTNGNQVYNGVISGTGHLLPRGTGNVIFNAANTYNDGTYGVILSGGSVGLGADSVSSSPPNIDSSPVGTGIFAIDPTLGNATIFASGSAHTVANPIEYLSTNAMTLGLGGSNDLTLSGAFQLALPSDPYGTNRSIQVNNTANTFLSGVISDNGLGSGITKSGAGTLYLNGINTYTGPTTNTAGLLAGNGTIAGPVFVQTNSSIGGGSSSALGTLTISSNLTLNGNVFIRVNKSLSPSNDLISVSGVLANIGTGTVTVTNTGANALVIGDRFQIFSAPVSNGNTLSIAGGGVNWTNKLAVDGSIQVLSIPSPVATNPTNITFKVSGSSLSLSWPADHLGWTLLTNSVSVANTNYWFPYPGSAALTNVSIPINNRATNVFYRLVYPYP